MRRRAIYIDSFVDGTFTVKSPLGGQALHFEDSDIFGPSEVNLKNGEPKPIPDGLAWFWSRYPAWRKAGRPVTERPLLSTPCGMVPEAKFPKGLEYE